MTLIYFFRKRIYELTPQIPSMASIPEDDLIEETSEYEKTILQNFLQKSRRRDSVSSVSSSGTSGDLSDEEEEPQQDVPPQRPDYMNLGSDFGEEAAPSRYHFYR